MKPHQLPARSFSCELQKRMVKASVQGPFRESMQRMQEAVGLTVPMRSLEQIIEDAAQDRGAHARRPMVPGLNLEFKIACEADQLSP